MAYDEGLAHRVRELIGDMDGMEAKTMFGGVGYILNGNMAVGISGDDLIVRVGPEKYDDTLNKPHVKPFGPTGRTMTGWVMVESGGVSEDDDLEKWVQIGVDFASGLAPK
jgi:TfoX/Sxy family transcriptional regulator of competence genes